MTECFHCGAPTTNGLALCDLSMREVSIDLEHIGIYFRNLARWRPGRAGSRPVPGSRVLYDGVDRGDSTGDRISDRLDEAMTALLTWARALVKDRPHLPRPLTYADAVLADDLPAETAEALTDDPAEAVRLLCEGFEEHLTSVATLDWCGEFVSDLGRHEEILRKLTETAVPGWYGGACRRCGVATYVVPGLTWVTCGGCGATTYAHDHIEVIRKEACAWVARPKALAEAVVALVPGEISVPDVYSRIRWWAHKGHLTPIRRIARGYVWSEAEERMVVGNQEVGQARYQLGEVLDLVQRPTRRLETGRAS